MHGLLLFFSKSLSLSRFKIFKQSSLCQCYNGTQDSYLMHRLSRLPLLLNTTHTACKSTVKPSALQQPASNIRLHNIAVGACRIFCVAVKMTIWVVFLRVELLICCVLPFFLTTVLLDLSFASFSLSRIVAQVAASTRSCSAIKKSLLSNLSIEVNLHSWILHGSWTSLRFLIEV